MSAVLHLLWRRSFFTKACAGLIVLSLIGSCPRSEGQEPSDPASHAPAAQPDDPSRTSADAPLRRDLTSKDRKRRQEIRLESDDWTFRPTVVVRRGTSQGSGTIIASIRGQTLVTTAAHVIRGPGPVSVELHRYNLGIERQASAPDEWPRQVHGEPLALDSSADVAIIRIGDMVALPYVAKLGVAAPELTPSGKFTSVGVDLGTKLSSWDTRLVESTWLSLNDNSGERPFLVTAGIPEHGRSGGGLFDKNGKLVGVCIGHAELAKGKRMGIFSSVESVRELIRRHDLTSVVEQSEARQARLARNLAASSSRSGLVRTSRPTMTPAELTDTTGSRP